MSGRRERRGASVRIATLGAMMAAAGVWLAADRASGREHAPNSWQLVLERPSSAKYEDFSFPDTSYGWLVTATGDVLHTRNGGRSWTVQTRLAGLLRSVEFLDRRRGFAGTLSGTLYATTDGGVTWTDITKQLPKAAKGFCGITHIGERVYVVGRYQGDASDYFFSPDGGKSWQWTDLSSIAHGLVDIVFVNDSVGFIGGMGRPKGTNTFGAAMILKTTDGGKRWRRVYEHDGGRGFAWKIFPVSPRLIYVGLQSQDGVYRVAKSTDGGEKWDTLTVATGRATGPGVQGIGFLDANTGWVGGFFSGMYETADGGLTWTPVPGMTDRLINRYYRVGNALLAGGSRGILRFER